MAAQPKKRQAKSRTRTRKSTKIINLPALVKCKKCNNLRYPHRACPNCGNYDYKNKISKPKSKEKTIDEKEK